MTVMGFPAPLRHNLGGNGSPAMATLKLRAFGNSVGVILPKDLLARLGAAEGDALHAVETPDGGVLLTAHDPELDEQLRIGRDLMRRYRDTSRALAK